MNILEESRCEAELSLLLDICTCGLNIVHSSFQHGEKASNLGAKKCLNVMFKIIDESPSRADYGKLTSSFLSLNLINLVEIPDSCEKWLHNLLQKLVDGRLVTLSLVDNAKKEFQKVICDVFRENKALYRNYKISSHNLDEFYMEYLKDSIR